jgi:hypothetical protein
MQINLHCKTLFDFSFYLFYFFSFSFLPFIFALLAKSFLVFCL